MKEAPAFVGTAPRPLKAVVRDRCGEVYIDHSRLSLNLQTAASVPGVPLTFTDLVAAALLMA